MTWPMLDWPYPLWVQTSAQFHQQFPWAGMIAGSYACWYATVLHTKDRFWMRPVAPRLGAPAAARHLTTLVGWLVGAYLIGLAPVVVSTVGGTGTPDPLVMASGALAVVAVVALGYAFVVFRIVLFVVIAIAAAALAGKAMTRRRVRRSLLDSAIYLALPAVLVTIAMLRPPVVFTAVQSTPVCTETREIRYCVHDGNRERLGDLVRLVDPMIMRYGSKPENIDQVWDQALLPYPRNLERDRGIEVASLEPDGTIETEVATTAAGIYACPWDGRSDDRDRLLLAVAVDVDQYLGTGVRDGWLAHMSVAEVQQWLATHQKQLHDCTLTEDQLPGSRNR
ncbi:hypothetical protein JCM33774_75990 [Actinophytocola sp. KF-1]